MVGDAVFRSTGKRIDFPGFFRAYVEGSDDPEAALEGQEVLLPVCVGAQDKCLRLSPRTTMQLSQLYFRTSAATRDVAVCE